MSTLSRAITTLTLLAFLCVCTNAVAGVHVVRFGGEHGAVYTPNNLFLITNDIIQFEGDLARYPLRFVEVPEGAEMAEVRSGTEFSYRVTRGGHYRFVCDNGGFEGAFSAIDERIGVDVSDDPFALAIYPNPASLQLHLRGIDPAAITSASLTGLDGLRRTLPLEVHASVVRFDLTSLDLLDGMYMLEIVTREKVYARKVMIVR